MTPETLRPADEELVVHDEQEITRLQAEAAQKAETIGSFRNRFHSMVERAFDAGRIQDEALIDRKTDAVDVVTRNHSDIRIDTTEAGVLGYNRIGAGRAGMRISRQTLAGIQSEDEKISMTQVVSHELAHGEQVQLKGDFTLGEQVIDHTVLFEGHAEINGNEGAGMSISQHREGQPAALYGEGQDLAVDIISKVGRAKFEEVMTETGNLAELQRAMAA